MDLGAIKQLLLEKILRQRASQGQPYEVRGMIPPAVMMQLDPMHLQEFKIPQEKTFSFEDLLRDFDSIKAGAPKV